MEYKTLGEQLRENEDIARILKDRRGSATFTFKGLMDLEEKTTLTETAMGAQGTGVLRIDRQPEIQKPTRRKLFMRDLLTATPTDMQNVGYVKVTTDVAIVTSPQTETAAKEENAMVFSSASTGVKTVSTFLPASRQILEDLPGLEGFISTSLMYAVRKKEDQQILLGDNTGQNLNGFSNQASAFNTSLLVAGDGWQYADYIIKSCEQLAAADELDPDFVALSPTVYWRIRGTKDANGQYVYGNPSLSNRNYTIWGLRPIPCNALATNQFIVGTSDPTGAVIRDRMELKITISTQHSDFWSRNMVAILAEERIALQVFRPTSYLTGSFTQSPA